MMVSPGMNEVRVGNMKVSWNGTYVSLSSQYSAENIKVPAGGISRLDLEAWFRVRILPEIQSDVDPAEIVEAFMSAVEELHNQELAAGRSSIFSDAEDSLGRWTRIK